MEHSIRVKEIGLNGPQKLGKEKRGGNKTNIVICGKKENENEKEMEKEKERQQKLAKFTLL